MLWVRRGGTTELLQAYQEWQVGGPYNPRYVTTLLRPIIIAVGRSSVIDGLLHTGGGAASRPSTYDLGRRNVKCGWNEI